MDKKIGTGFIDTETQFYSITLKDIKELSHNSMLIIPSKFLTDDKFDKAVHQIFKILDLSSSISIGIKKSESFYDVMKLKNKFLELEATKDSNRIFISMPGGNDITGVNYEYVSIKDINEGEKFLNLLVEDINSRNGSPLEKVFEAYTLVYKFKIFRDVEGISSNAKNLYSILNNKYIVCEGYTRMFNHILEKLGFKCSMLYYDINDNINELFETEFGRKISPEELKIISKWRTEEYGEELIKFTIKLSIYNNISDFNQIDKTIHEWGKMGIKNKPKEAHSISAVKIVDSENGVDGTYLFDPSDESSRFYDLLPKDEKEVKKGKENFLPSFVEFAMSIPEFENFHEKHKPVVEVEKIKLQSFQGEWKNNLDFSNPKATGLLAKLAMVPSNYSTIISTEPLSKQVLKACFMKMYGALMTPTNKNHNIDELDYQKLNQYLEDHFEIEYKRRVDETGIGDKVK